MISNFMMFLIRVTQNMLLSMSVNTAYKEVFDLYKKTVSSAN